MKIYSVSEFVQTIRDYLSETIGPVVIQGEVTNFRQPKGNLVYFELKDKESRILCFMLFWELKVPMEDGAEIRVLGTPSLFKGSGGFHIRVQEIELVGEGALRRALEALRTKMEQEGLFAPERKRTLPPFPSRIGLVTSPDAAAYTDVLRILKNRWSGLIIKFFPVAVQGIGSIAQIVKALEYLNREQDSEIIILTRGGGSLEDLQSFNSEEVVRAIFASRIPVVCGVGHERDITLADLAADQRASTPSNAAEIAVPDKREIINTIDWETGKIESNFSSLLEKTGEAITEKVFLLEKGIQDQRDRFVYLYEKLGQNWRSFVQNFLWQQERLQSHLGRISGKFSSVLETIKERLAVQERLIATLSPQATLERGYSLTYLKDKQKIIKDSQEVRSGDSITTRLAKGNINSKVNPVT